MVKRLFLSLPSIFMWTVATWSGATQAAEFVGVDWHGALSLTSSYSDRHNFLGDTKHNVDLTATEATLNGQHRFDSGVRLAAQVYAYQLGDHRAFTLDYANVSYAITDWLGFSLGRNKVPFGLYREIMDVDIAHPFAFLPLANVPKEYRAFAVSYDGLGLFGTVNLERAGSLDYKAFAGWRGKQDTDALFFRKISTLTNVDEAVLGFMYGGAVFYNTPIQGLRVGVSATFLPHVTDTGLIRKKREVRYQAADERSLPDQTDGGFRSNLAEAGLSPEAVDELYGSDYSLWDDQIAGRRVYSQVDVASFAVSAEYVRDSYSLAVEYNRTGFDIESSGALPSSVQNADDGISLVGTWKVAARLELGAYLDFHWNDETDRGGRNFKSLPKHAAFTRDYAIAASYKIKEWWNVKAEYHFIEGTGLLNNSEFENGDPSNWSKQWSYFVLKTTFSF